MESRFSENFPVFDNAAKAECVRKEIGKAEKTEADVCKTLKRISWISLILLLLIHTSLCPDVR